MTPRAETLADRLARHLATKDGSIDSSDDAIELAVVHLVDRVDELEEAEAIGPVPADAEAGFMVEGSLRRALRLIRHEHHFYGHLMDGWSDERIDRLAAALAQCLGREWFGVC